MDVQRERAFSGIQPTGKIHIGNYVGALSLWVENQDLYDNIFCIVDLHSITIPEAIDPAVLRAQTRETAALYVAAGINPEKSVIFVQSAVSAHAELAWILNCVTPLGWLERMTQFKTKSAAQESVGTGLLDYPVLQAADILLYGAHRVPVGEDQRQHVELTRDIAQRFHHMFGAAFVLPEPLIRSSGARIMGLDEPTMKMSKSLGTTKAGHSIGLVDTPDQIRAAVMRATTDSSNDTRFETAGPGVVNLLTLFEILSGQNRDEVENVFEGKGYGFLKRTVADQIVASLEPIRTRFTELMADPAGLEGILVDGADRARQIANATLDKVKGLTGLG
ncbi:MULTISPECIES: tryptophan--tRNA ligase [unclassified Frankia]|uniref:tryptophan--tRNA ligase n=1 Tax=unclassified Frankia TaxID=2632575 RepID=UPI002AD4496B|nr:MULTISPECIES: tryptophan--tRNA ligase [unclassified Frankia]